MRATALAIILGLVGAPIADVDSVSIDTIHAHGDTDDHHENPDSPCHHHVAQDCGHSHVLIAFQVEVGTARAETFLPAVPFQSPPTDLVARRVHHVPIA